MHVDERMGAEGRVEVERLRLAVEELRAQVVALQTDRGFSPHMKGGERADAAAAGTKLPLGRDSRSPRGYSLSRRKLLTTAGVATVGALAVMGTHPGVSRADDGDDLVLGEVSDAGDETLLYSPLNNKSVSVLWLTDLEHSSGRPYSAPGAGSLFAQAGGSATSGVFGVGYSGRIGVSGASVGGGTGVKGQSDSGSGVEGYGDSGVRGYGGSIGVAGIANGSGLGVYGRGGTNWGVYGLSNSSAGVYGSTDTGNGGVMGEITKTDSSSSGVYGVTAGTAAGVWGDLKGQGYAGVLGRTFTQGHGVYGQVWQGTGEGVYGEIVPPGNSSAAVHGTTSGSGPGVKGESVAGARPLWPNFPER